MSSQEQEIPTSRIAFLKALLPEDFHEAIDQLDKPAKDGLKVEVLSATAQKTKFANDLARLSENNALLVGSLLDDKVQANSLRDVALGFSTAKLVSLMHRGTTSVSRTLKAHESPDPNVKEGAPDKTIKAVVRKFQCRLFQEVPSAVISRLVKDGDIHLPTIIKNRVSNESSITYNEAQSTALRNGLVQFFEVNQPDFDIRRESILSRLSDSKSLEGIDDANHSDVVLALKKLQTTQALTTDPDIIPTLAKSNLTNAFQIANIPQQAFLKRYGKSLGGEEAAKEIHTHATNTSIRNDEALVQIHTALRGSGLAAVDGTISRKERLNMIQKLPTLPKQANLEQLFGSMDYCACDNCNSVTSPAAYFVELLEFLRNNNLDPDSPNLGPDWEGSPLEKLLRRRPDLANLELTCANTNTVLPYIDLANEVMESFVVHLDEFQKNPQQVDLDVYNIDPDGEGLGGSSRELLAEPRNTNYEAYCTLKSAVYPAAALPFNQPIEEARLLLDFLKTSRAEIGEIFREAYIPPSTTIPDTTSTSSSLSESAILFSETSDAELPTTLVSTQPLPPEQKAELVQIRAKVLGRSNDAESLLLTQEEYIIITKQAFWPKRYFEIRHNTTYTPADYQKRIGVKPLYKYWGVDYSSDSEIRDIDETRQKGLTFVKKQFLPRSGISYQDLATLLTTYFINPNLPTGRDLAIMSNIKFSYMFLKSLLDPYAKTTRGRFHRMLEFLDDPTHAPSIGEFLRSLFSANHPPEDKMKRGCDHDDHHRACKCHVRDKFHRWIYRNFDRIGSLIVLDSGEGPKLPFEAELFISGQASFRAQRERDVRAQESGHQGPEDPFPDGLPSPGSSDNFIAHLYRDGRIVAKNGFLMARMFPGGLLLLPNWQPWATKYGNQTVYLRRTDVEDTEWWYDGVIYRKGSYIIDRYERHLDYLPVHDDCNLDNVRLRHLDSSPLTKSEFDRIHRFLRLWKKLGWSMQEVDAALRGLGNSGEDGPTEALPPSPTPPQLDPGSLDVDWDAFQDACSSGTCGDKRCRKCADKSHDHDESLQKQTPKIKPVLDITPGFLHQVNAIKKLVSLTGLSVLELLSFWTVIDMYGSNSLYAQLFLTHNMLGTDPVFKADTNGLYLSASPPEKISDHIPVLLASMRLKAEGLKTILEVAKVSDELTLDAVSAIYRYTLLSRVLGIKPTDLSQFSVVFGSPWTSAQATLDILTLWNKLTAVGFSLAQIAYLTANIDNPLRPIGPSQTSLLRTTKLIYDGLNTIEAENPDFHDTENATTETVTAKAQLLFGTTIASSIADFLNGNTVFSTNAPAGLSLIIPTDLATRVKYSASDAKIQISGQLTSEATSRLKALSEDPGWQRAIGRLAKQALSFFQNTLSDIFKDAEDAEASLVKGDTLPKPVDVSLDTVASEKRLFFLKTFMPVLRHKLSDALVADTMAAISSLSRDLTLILLKNILVLKSQDENSSQSAMDALQKIHKNTTSQTQEKWIGYLVVSTTDNYTFGFSSLTNDDKPPDIILDNQNISFNHQQADPSNVWFSEPVTLLGGRIYSLHLSTPTVENLQWMSPRSTPSKIPPSSLLPDYSIDRTLEVFSLLVKSAVVINALGLTSKEVNYLQGNGDQFGQFDLNAVTLKALTRLEAYTSLKKSLPGTGPDLIDLFKWASGPSPASSSLFDMIHATTLWDLTKIQKLCAGSHFNLQSPENFLNEINLVRLQAALKVADKIGMDIDKLFIWGRPHIKFWPARAIAQDIRNAVRSTMQLTDWEVAVRPLSDSLRKSQRDALIAFLTVQPDLVAQGVIDSDSLFEFLLIDVSMGACLETSRLKQATSSVQQFVQRCMLGLEDKSDGSGVGINALDRERWEWMQRYRVWEAARKVFLFPENWIVSSLRDDKSPIYNELEAALLQKDVTAQTVTDAVQSYLFSLDSIANLDIIGIHLQDETLTVDNSLGTVSKHINVIHIFGRSRRAPFFFHYRSYDVLSQNWAPWQRIQVDIPSYEVSEAGQLPGNGTYLVPFTFNGRLIVGIPDIRKKTLPAPINNTDTYGSYEQKSVASVQPTDYWEIKMGYSELRNGRWTQKVITTDAFQESPIPATLPGINSFQFVPRTKKLADGPVETVSIDCIRRGSALVGRFTFDGALLNGNGLPKTNPQLLPNIVFQYSIDALGPDPGHLVITKVMSSFQAKGESEPLALFDKAPRVVTLDNSLSWPEIEYSPSSGAVSVTQPFSHTFAHKLLGKVIAANGINGIYAFFQTLSTDDQKYDAFGQDDSAVYSELKRPYSLYNWELGFHAPMALAESYLQTQQYDLALKMCHYVFDPFAVGTDEKRFWKWTPFREVDSINSMDKLFDTLRPNTPSSSQGQINQWRDNPFNPHVIARLRPVSYMKWVAMKYIEILIAYGDYYFKQNTLEMIPQAIQCYVLASHVYGPRGQKIPKRGKTKPQTYKSLRNKWDPFGNAMVQLELMFPFSNQTDLPFGNSNGVVGLANLFGFATAHYFCIPDNPQLASLRDLIDDRLFKIRHCQDIFGNVRHLPLYEPPIDPGLLVAASAQGLSIASILNDLDTAMPNYRFTYLLAKAIDLCNELKNLGNALQVAKEKKDVETLALMKQTQEGIILNLGMEQKKLALEEAQRSLEAIQQNRELPAYRMRHQLQLLGLPTSNVPTADADVVEIAVTMPELVDSSGLKLIPTEKEEVDKANAAADWQEAIGILETIASVFHVFPTMGANGMPLGVGVDVKWGFGNLANAVSAVARGLQVHAARLSHQSQSAARTTSFIRASQDRGLGANASAYEIKNFDKQALTQNIRIAIANHEIGVQQKLMDHSQEVEEFLKTKYTNKELYEWLQRGLQGLYYQLYSMAHGWAKKAELAYRLDRGEVNTNFIQYGYWESAYDGLLAGERLYLGLKQMEEAYNETRGYDFEVTKFVSLRQTSPISLLQLADAGRCKFTLPEVLFDMDFPGHYFRKIKSVSITIPCVVGPYTSVNCTLRLLSHRHRTTASAASYPQKVDQDDDRFRTNAVPISAIAVSSARSDSGVFDLNFQDERFMPFEGAGCISDWSLELPDGFRQFDYRTITDIVLQIRYTARDGGAALAAAAAQSVATYIHKVADASQTDGLYAIFDVKNEFATAWYQGLHPPQQAGPRTFVLADLTAKLPVFTKGRAAKDLVASDVLIVTDASFNPSAITLAQGNDDNSTGFTDARSASFKSMSVYAAHDLSFPIDRWTLSITDTTTAVNGLWIVAKYVIN
jgi:hypothetical protein